MASVDWPERLVPKRFPSPWKAFGVMAVTLGVAAAICSVFVGAEHGLAMSATFFPALILTTVYGGFRWGAIALAATIGLGFLAPGLIAIGAPAPLLLFAVSSAAVVIVSSLLRQSVIGLDEARQALSETRNALERSEARARLAQEIGGFGFWDWDVIANEGVWSPGLYRIYGIDPAKPASVRDLLAAVHPDDRERARQANITAVKEGRMESTEYRVVRPDGEVRWIAAHAEMTRNAEGRVARAVGVNIDVTAQRRAQSKLEESEARFRSLADGAPAHLWVSDAQDNRIFVNQAFLDFLGLDYDTALKGVMLEFAHPEDVDRVRRDGEAGAASGKRYSTEGRFRRADGEWRWLHAVIQPRLGPDGDFQGMFGIAYDITDARAAEENLSRINDLLAERVQAALAERDLAESALRRAQKMEAVGQLTGGVAHDFNNLLTVVMGALDLMQRHPDDVPRRERMIEAALGAARRGERLTHQLLAFSRRQTLRPQRLCIDDLVLDSEPLLRRLVGEAVRLTIAPGTKSAEANIDPSQFEAALMNLVVNARDAVADGGAIRIETAVCLLGEGEVEETPAGEYLMIAVHDTGIGMSPEVVARVFEPFFTTKEIGKGTGLGLSQVYGFARQSGGGALIDSAPGKGATVRIYLPKLELETASEVEPAEAAPEPATSNRPSLQVLLVEDDTEVGDLVCAMLEELGHTTLRAECVDDALPILRGSTPIDLMLTDLVMPGARNGVDLAHEASSLRPDLPIILSSGYTGDALSAAEAAPWPLLRKPYAADTLARTIEAVAPQPGM